jgi:hypothetical protein
MKDLKSLGTKDLASKGMATMFGNASNMTHALNRVRQKDRNGLFLSRLSPSRSGNGGED